MSSPSARYSWKSTADYLGRFRYIEFLIKSAPVFSLAFIGCVALIYRH